MRHLYLLWFPLLTSAFPVALAEVTKQSTFAEKSFEIKPRGATRDSESEEVNDGGLVRRELHSTSSEERPQVKKHEHEYSSEVKSHSSKKKKSAKHQGSKSAHRPASEVLAGERALNSSSSDSLRLSLMHVTSWLKDKGIEHVLVGNTALGMLRTGDVIDGDRDVDLALRSTDIEKACEAIAADGKDHGARIANKITNPTSAAETGTGFQIFFDDVDDPGHGQSKGDSWGPVVAYGFEESSEEELCLSPFNILVLKSWMFPVSWQHPRGSMFTVPMPKDSASFVSYTFGDHWQDGKHSKPRFNWKCCPAGHLGNLGARLLVAGETCKERFGRSGESLCCSPSRRIKAGSLLLLLGLATIASLVLLVVVIWCRNPALGGQGGFPYTWPGVLLLTSYSLSYLLWSSTAYATRLGEASIVLILFAGQILKVKISLGLWTSVHGLRLKHLCTILVQERHRLWMFAMPAALATLSDLLSLDAMQHLDPATYAALFGMRTIITAGAWALLFREGLGHNQWLALGVISCGCLLKLREVAQPGALFVSVIIQAIVASTLNAMANLQSEWLRQMEPEACLHFHRLVLSCMSFAFTFPSLCLWLGMKATVDSMRFAGLQMLMTDPLALIQVLAFVAAGLTGGYIVGRQSIIQHEVALCFAALLGVPTSLVLFEHALSAWSYAAVLMMLLGIAWHTQPSKGKGNTGAA